VPTINALTSGFLEPESINGNGLEREKADVSAEKEAETQATLHTQALLEDILISHNDTKDLGSLATSTYFSPLKEIPFKEDVLSYRFIPNSSILPFTLPANQPVSVDLPIFSTTLYPISYSNKTSVFSYAVVDSQPYSELKVKPKTYHNNDAPTLWVFHIAKCVDCKAEPLWVTKSTKFLENL